VTIERVVELILGQAGVLILLLVILFGGSRGWWVFGWYAKEQRERINRLERQLERATGVAERGTDAADRATRLVERHTEVPGA
jgi:hypothetical protein